MTIRSIKQRPISTRFPVDHQTILLARMANQPQYVQRCSFSSLNGAESVSECLRQGLSDFSCWGSTVWDCRTPQSVWTGREEENLCYEWKSNQGRQARIWTLCWRMCAGAISKVRRDNQNLEFWNGLQWSVPHVALDSSLCRKGIKPIALKDANISTCHNRLCLFLIILLFRPPFLINTFSVHFCRCLYCHLSKYINVSILIDLSSYPFIHPHKYVYLSVSILSVSLI
jgi:hypothetical protein